MTEDNAGSSEYIHGSSPEEHHRLSLLNDLLNTACLRELGLKPGERVLDVGSGLGQFSRLMAQSVGSEGRVVGIERAREQIEEARHLASQSGEAGRVEFRTGDALALPLDSSEEGGFDVVHARFLLEHVPDPAAVVRQMLRALRPGGRMFISDDDHDNFRPWPEPPGFSPIWSAYVQSFKRLGNDPYVGRRLVALLQEAGLVSLRNACVFFGGCAGNEQFLAVTDNLAGAFEGAKETMLADDLLDEATYQAGIDGLRQWRSNPSAALWYTVYCAEGVRPE